MADVPPVVSGHIPVLGHFAEFVRQPIELLKRGQREAGNAFSLKLPGRTTVVLLGSAYSRFFFAETDKTLSIGSAYPFFGRMFAPDFYFIGNQVEYKKQRDIVLPRFRGSQLDGYVAAMESETDAFIRRIGDIGEFDLTHELGPLVMRIAARAFLGEDFGRRMNSDFFAEFREFSKGIDFFTPSWLPLPHMIRSKRARNRLRRALGAMIHERRERPVDPSDFLQSLVEATFDDGEPLSELLLINFILFFTWAGHETTAGHLSWALIDLLTNPGELVRVRAEVDSVTANGLPVSVTTLKSLPHLDNCLHETERLHPIAHLLARQATETIELDGHLIPKGSTVMIAPSVSHRLESEYSRPGEFYPDRYLATPKERYSLIGFGGGVHRCIGVHFAYSEMKVVLTKLFQRYSFELLDENPTSVAGNRSKWPASPCRVRFHRRVDREE